ncbi:MAG: S-layer homology domain-containing protein [bacterium]
MAFDINADGMLPYASGTQMIQTPFIDIFGHPYQSAISTLAGLGIVSTQSPQFTPDNYLHRYDFVIMLVNAMLVSKGKTLSTDYISGFASPFVDVGSASYSPFVYYAYDNGLLDFLTVNKR